MCDFIRTVNQFSEYSLLAVETIFRKEFNGRLYTFRVTRSDLKVLVNSSCSCLAETPF